MKTECSCATWASSDAMAPWEHHPNCKRWDPAADLRALITPLVRGREAWGAEEDGIPEFVWDAYCAAKLAIGEPPATERADTGSFVREARP